MWTGLAPERTGRIGYADGYSRRLGNGAGFMSVRGRRVPVPESDPVSRTASREPSRIVLCTHAPVRGP